MATETVEPSHITADQSIEIFKKVGISSTDQKETIQPAVVAAHAHHPTDVSKQIVGQLAAVRVTAVPGSSEASLTVARMVAKFA